MSIELFKESYQNSDIVQLRKFMKLPKVISTKKFVEYVEESFMANQPVYDILVLILFNQYDLNKVVTDIIRRDNTDLLENILSNKYEIELDEDLILLTVPIGRISMAKAIYEYIHDDYNYYKVVMNLLDDHDFILNQDEKSVDSFVLGLHQEENEIYHPTCRGRERQRKIKRCSSYVKSIIPCINPDFWDNFAIKYAVELSDLPLVEKLLLHPNVDPGADNNCPLKIAMNHRYYDIANELLKHPLVAVDCITVEFIEYLINRNCLCVIEKILRLGDDNITAIFKRRSTIDFMLDNNNSITYLAIKLGVFDVSELIEYDGEEIVRKYLRNFKIDDTYVSKSYESNLDPDEIFDWAIKHDDIELAKTIKNYPISISYYRLLSRLEQYDNDVSAYIYDKILIKYCPDDLIEASMLYNGLFEKIFNVVMDSPDINWEYVYDHCNDDARDIILAHIKEHYNMKKYKKFCKDRAID